MITRIHARRGATLPVVILLTAVIAISLTAAFSLNSSEMRTVDNQQEQIDAFSLAESGRERYLADRASFGLVGEPAPSESIRVAMTGGYADVVVTRLRQSSGGIVGLYALRSRGVRTVAQRPGVPAATRTVGQIFKWERGMMNVPGAWTSLSGIRKSGGSGVISGVDACGALPAIGGVAVPTVPGYVQTGGTAVPAGIPPIKDLGPQPSSNDSARIDWPGIVNGSSMTPSLTIPPASWPSFADTSYWPVIKVVGDIALPSSGRGVLIVTGNFTMSGSVGWDGVLLVGGKITSSGNNTVRGVIVTGLNTKLGMATPESDIGSGTKTFQYDSCLAQRALQPFQGLVPMDNAWADNWASY